MKLIVAEELKKYREKLKKLKEENAPEMILKMYERFITTFMRFEVGGLKELEVPDTIDYLAILCNFDHCSYYLACAVHGEDNLRKLYYRKAWDEAQQMLNEDKDIVAQILRKNFLKDDKEWEAFWGCIGELIDMHTQHTCGKKGKK